MHYPITKQPTSTPEFWYFYSTLKKICVFPDKDGVSASISCASEGLWLAVTQTLRTSRSFQTFWDTKLATLTTSPSLPFVTVSLSDPSFFIYISLCANGTGTLVKVNTIYKILDCVLNFWQHHMLTFFKVMRGFWFWCPAFIEHLSKVFCHQTVFQLLKATIRYSVLLQ